MRVTKVPVFPKNTDEVSKIVSPLRQKTYANLFSTSPYGKIRNKDLSVFCRKVAFLLGGGIQLKEIMPILANQSPKHMNTIMALHKKILSGDSYSHALHEVKAFPAFMVRSVEIGERSSKLYEISDKLADFYEAKNNQEKELFSALMYPAVIIIMMIMVTILSITTVLPGYADIFESSGVPLPFLTNLLLNISGFAVSNWILILIFHLLLFTAAVIFLHTPSGKKLISLLSIKASLSKQSINLNFVQSMSFLLSSGISITDALPIYTKGITNFFVNKQLSEVIIEIKSGSSFWKAIRKIPFIDPMFIELSKIGEETGSLPQITEKCRIYFETQYSRNLKNINKLLEPIITIFMGLLLAIIMLAVVLPAFTLAGYI